MLLEGVEECTKIKRSNLQYFTLDSVSMLVGSVCVLADQGLSVVNCDSASGHAPKDRQNAYHTKWSQMKHNIGNMFYVWSLTHKVDLWFHSLLTTWSNREL